MRADVKLRRINGKIGLFMKKHIKIIFFAVLAFALFFLEGVFAADIGGKISVNGAELDVYTLQKAGNDDENFVILFLGDGYTDKEQNELVSDAQLRAKALIRTEPFRSCSGKINVYAVPTVSKESGVSVRRDNGDDILKDTYFKIMHYGNITSFTRDGEANARAIKEQLEKSFLDSGATVGTIHIISNSEDYFGSSTSALFSFASLNEIYSGGEASIHEIAHSIGGLKDEYGVVKTGVNASRSGNRDDVSWKKLLGFRGIGITLNGNSDISYVPSLSCIMMDPGNGGFCQVCQMELVRRMNLPLYTSEPMEYYVAAPDITIEHDDISTIGNAYKNCRINESNVANANGHDLEFRTVVQNFSNTIKRFKLIFRVTDNSDTDKYYKEEIFEVPPFLNDDDENAKKSLSLTFENVSGLTETDRASGQVIDCATESVVATERTERIPMSRVEIHHKIKDKNGIVSEMPNTFTTTLYIPKGTMFLPKSLKQLNGYSYIGNNWASSATAVTEAVVEVDYYYGEKKIDVVRNGKTLKITPMNIPTGSVIIAAFYDSERLVEINDIVCDGQPAEYTAQNDFSYAKVFAFEKLNTLFPICKAEKVVCD